MAININAKTAGVGGIEMSSDSSGDINIQSGGSTKLAITSAGAAVTGTFTVNGAPAGDYNGFKNRIINGDMRIDQRNAGASVTVDTSPSGVFIADRFVIRNASASANCTGQQVSDAPAGFVNSLKVTVTATDASYSTATSYTRVRQGVEANNIADLGWGATGAQTVTLSFWVKSSLTGTFSVSLINSAYNYSYPVSYTISAANTWEQKSITIAGPTSGTWATGINAGVYLEWTLGAASNILGTSGSWAAARYEGVTGQVNLFATNGATFYITGVQLEKGSTATSFDYRDYGRELAMCQRYFQNFYGQQVSMTRFSASSGSGYAWIVHPEMRTAATVTFGTYSTGSGYPSSGAMLYGSGVTNGFKIYSSDNIAANSTIYFVASSNTTLSAEL